MKELKIDLTGFTFGKFKVIKQVEKPKHLKNNGIYWLCECECGNQKIIKTGDINRGKGLSCRKCSKNKFDLSGEFGVGYTSKGEEFYFDLEDYDLIKNYTWCKTNDGYMIAFVKGEKNKFVYMHRLVMGLMYKNGFDVDHENHNTIDNRKEKLRICTHQENIMNSKISKNNTSGVTGVRFDTTLNKWAANIMLNGKYIHLGLFSEFNDAVKARKEAENVYFGVFACNIKENNNGL